MWGREAEEESDGDSQVSFGIHDQHQDRSPSPEHPEAPDIGKDDSNLVYARVSQDHVAKKR